MGETLEETMRRIRTEAAGLIRKAGERLYLAAADATPVRTGKARANWNCSVNGTDASITDETLFDPGRGAVSFSETVCGDLLTVENHLTYVPVLEEGTLQRPSAGIRSNVLAEMSKCGVVPAEGGR